MDKENIIESTNEQAVASWANYLNQVRLDRLTERIIQQDINREGSEEIIENAISDIKTQILSGGGRGGQKGVHGFIAEIAECGIGNARAKITGQTPGYVWINDNGPADLLREGVEIQQKFVQSGGHLSLKAVSEHLEKYPDFLAKGGKYQIPKDHYDKIMKYLSMSEETASKLSNSNGDFSLRQWREVHNFFDSGNIDIDSLEGSILDYNDVQKGNIDKTFAREKKNLAEIDKVQREEAYNESKPSVEEGLKVAAVAATVEAITSLFIEIRKKRKEGTKLSEFTSADWGDAAKAAGLGAAKGGVRGTSVYLLSNFAHTPAAVATAITTAAISVASQINLYRKGDIDTTELIENSGILCIDASVSALSSLIGQTVIPVPVVGAIVGNAVGMMLYQIGKDTFGPNARETIERYLREIKELEEQLDAEYKECVERLNKIYNLYVDLVLCAFNPDPEIAFEGSIALAKHCGVPASDVLDSREKISEYFLNI